MAERYPLLTFTLVQNQDTAAQELNGGLYGVIIQAGTWNSATVTLEISVDGGTTWMNYSPTAGAYIDATANEYFNMTMCPCLVRASVSNHAIATGKMYVAPIMNNKVA